MKTSFKKSKNLLALCLSVLMVTSGVAALASCSDSSTTDSSSSSSSSSSATTTVNDTALITNGGFETFNTNNGLNAIGTSVTSWTRSVNSTSSGSALSSKAASGIIDTSAAAWDNLTGSKKEGAENMTEAEAKAVWDTLTVKDKLAFMEAWEDRDENDDKDIEDELDFYQAFNIDSGDIPTCVNPQTHYKEGEEGYGEDTNVLMIHNQYPETDSTATYKSLGTAQKYTSSSTVTVPAGTAAQFSVWVKTADLMCSDTAGNPQKAVGKGAYISVTHSVGSKSMPVFMVENINTEYMDDAQLSNGWMQYSFYLKGSSYANTTFSIVLGLGQGGGEDRGEYVNGYAFFDDAKCEIITQEAYTDAIVEGVDKTVDFNSEADAKKVDVSRNMTVNKFAFDFYGDFTKSEVLDFISATEIKATSSDIGNGTEYTSQAGNNPLPGLNDGKGLDGSKDVTKVYASFADLQTEATATGANEYLKAVYNNYFADDKFASEEILMLLSSQGVAYTAESTYTFGFGSSEYLAVSFFVKTSDLNGFTGAGITLKDGNNENSFSSIDTTNVAAVEIGDDEDIYDGWQQCFFFVKNDFEEKDKASFTLSFTFGPTTITDTTDANYYQGFAAFTGFKTYEMSKAEYSAVSDSTYAKVVSVTGTTAEKATGNGGFDEAANVPSNALKTGLANPKNYKGVYSDSYYVNQANGTSKEYNTNENAGLLNRDYFLGTDEDESYYDATSELAWMKGMTTAAGASTAKEVWTSMFAYNDTIGTATQPLFIWNAKETSYGFIGNSATVAANTYAKISVAVKVGALDTVANPNSLAAYVYLIDMDDDSYAKTLSIGSNLVYWYDDDGNICTGDPTKKSTEIAFKLQSNGLYKANKNWSAYASLTEEQKNAYFANLSAYDKNTNGDLVVAEGGASHAYSDYWNNEGEDGIAFYYKEGKYYADRAKTIAVSNLADITKASEADNSKLLPYRYLGNAEKTLMAKVGNTNGEWVNVSFYIHTGDEAKNYRLEVWSGDRTGEVKNPVNSYVAFDMNYAEDAESNFSSLIEEGKDKTGAEKFETIFSYYDSNKFLRYNKSLDENKIGNLYENSYVPSAQTAGIAYLYYEEGNERRMFADYSYSEVTVVAEEVTDDTDDTTSSSDDGTASETNPWLLASSIAIAAVLVLSIASIAVREILKKTRKNRAPKKAKKTKKN